MLFKAVLNMIMQYSRSSHRKQIKDVSYVFHGIFILSSSGSWNVSMSPLQALSLKVRLFSHQSWPKELALLKKKRAEDKEVVSMGCNSFGKAHYKTYFLVIRYQGLQCGSQGGGWVFLTLFLFSLKVSVW